MVEPDEVALDHGRARQVRQQPDGLRVEHELHVAVALLPRRHRVAVHGVHVDVDGQQVVAALGAVLEHVVDEVRSVQPLALQPALHVGEGDDDRVDVALVDPAPEVVHAEVPVVAHVVHLRRSLSQQPRSRAAVSSQWLSIARRARVGVAGQDRVDDRRCAGVGVLDVDGQHGDGHQHVVQVGLHLGDRRDQSTATRSPRRSPGAAGSRPAGARRSPRPRSTASQGGEQRLLAGHAQRPGRPPARPRPARRPGGTPGSPAARRRRPASSGLAPARRGWSADGRPPCRRRAAGGAHHAGRAQRGDRLPQRRPGDPHPVGQVPLRRQRRCRRVDAQPDRRRQPLDAVLERVPCPRAGPRTRLARRSLTSDGSAVSARRATPREDLVEPWWCARPSRPCMKCLLAAG